MADVAKAVGFRGASSYQRYEDAELFRKPYLPLDLAEKLARILAGRGVPPITAAEVMALAGAQPRSVPHMVPVVGYVGAGAEVFAVDDHAKGAGFDEVEIPIDGMSRSTVAVQVRGDSMLPVYRPGDLIFYDRNDNGDLLHLIGKDCVVRLTDGRTFVKELHHSNGEFWLHSYNSTPMINVDIEWAAKVAVIKRA